MGLLQFTIPDQNLSLIREPWHLALETVSPMVTDREDECTCDWARRAFSTLTPTVQDPE